MKQPAEIWRNQKTVHQKLGQQGVLLSWTKIHVAPSGFEGQVPYFVGIVKLESGDKLPVELVDCTDDVQFNAKVVLVLRKSGKSAADGVIQYGVKAKII